MTLAITEASTALATVTATNTVSKTAAAITTTTTTTATARTFQFHSKYNLDLTHFIWRHTNGEKASSGGKETIRANHHSVVQYSLPELFCKCNVII